MTRTISRRRLGLGLPAAALAIALGVVAPTLAHHTYSAFYLEDDVMEIEGEVVEFQYINPHAWLHVAAHDPFGRPRTYAAEWSARSRLERDGITRDTLKPGDAVRVWASPNRNPSDHRIRLKRIERTRDRWQWGQERREER